MGLRSAIAAKLQRPPAGRAVTPPSGKHGGEEHPKIGLVWKLMLCAQLCGLEASGGFEQLYTVPLLQTLQMPLRYVSLTGLLEGSVAMTLLPLIGWLTDKGSNTLCRKTIAIFFGAGLQIVGMTCVVSANVIHLMDMVNFNNRNSTHSTERTTGIMGNDSASWNQSSVTTAVPSSSIQNTEFFDSATLEVEIADDSVSNYSSEVPFKAILGMFGFIVLSLGFDTMSSVVRSFVLTCTPRAEHTSLLVLGLITASAGGLSTASLGIVDFTQLFGLSSDYEGSSLTIQTSLQGIFISSLVILGLLVTTLSGHRQHTLTLRHADSDDHAGAHRGDDHPAPHPFHDQLSESARVDMFESSVRSFAGAGVHFDQTLGLLSQSQDVTAARRRRGGSVNSDRTLLLSQEHDNVSRDSGEFAQSHTTSMSMSYGSRDSTFLGSEPMPQQHQQQSMAKTTLEDVPENAVLKIERPAAEPSTECCRWGFKTKIALIVVSTFFATGTMIMYTMTSSDFVAKAIYLGNPDAPLGSESVLRYQEGMRAASWGFVVYYATYLGVSFVHPRLLAKLGCRVEFVTVHLLTGLCMLVLSFTFRLEAFYLLSVAAGLHRACFYVLPFTITNDVVNDRISSTGGKANIGLAMSVVSACAPIAYCSIFPWIGPLEELLGNVVIPMWLGCAFACLASLSMIVLGDV